MRALVIVALLALSGCSSPLGDVATCIAHPAQCN